jgi:hypothetical protein
MPPAPDQRKVRTLSPESGFRQLNCLCIVHGRHYITIVRRSDVEVGASQLDDKSTGGPIGIDETIEPSQIKTWSARPSKLMRALM